MHHANGLPQEVRDALERAPHVPGFKRWPVAGGPRARFIALLLLLPLACDSAPRVEARYQPSPVPVVRAMLELAEVGPRDVVYDLGSGDGRIVIMAAREFGARGVGIDLNPELVALARANARAAGVEDRATFVEGDIFAADVRPATVVTLFLLDTVNLKLRPKLLAELKPGTRVVSHYWDMGDWKPDAQRRIGDRMIYLWRIPERT